jgi:ABC-type multidrug transport system ATPase subunit/pSer/pThr/pTyr-binding forkhead associated (FHA) protein
MTQRISLIVVLGKNRKVISVGEGKELSSFLVGRSAEADLFLSDLTVSRRHCRIFRQEQRIMVEDLGSRASTFLNGQKVSQPIGLHDGDEIKVGDVALRVRIEGQKVGGGAAALPIETQADQVIPLGREVLTIGRAPTCSLRLEHPVISRHHAEIQPVDGRFVVRDPASTNGTFLNGKALKEPRTLVQGDTLRIGPYRLIFDGASLISKRPEAGTRIEVRSLGKQVKDRQTSQPLWLLRDISLTILPREFVGLLGASGCGKSTFMDAVNGRRPAMTGAVLYNGENLYNHFDAFKRSIGYVPQELIFHQQLPLVDALRYASQLRLPDDVTPDEIETNIDRVLGIVGLSQQRSTLITHLSGGQKKRVSIAMELLSRPTLLFLDEATSGLDLGTEAQMMKLFRELADSGVTTLCITHYVDSLEMCDMVAYFVRGRLVYYGPPAELKSYFGISAIREVYLKETERTVDEWEATFRASPTYIRYIAERAEPAEKFEATIIRPGQAIETVRQSSPKKQLAILTRRYLQVMLTDWRNVLIMLSLAPVIGLLVSIVLSAGENESPIALASRQGQLCFTLTLTMFFLGIFGGIREIVKELPIYRHERFINLEILPYLGSKVLPLALIGALQTIELLLVAHLGIDFRVDGPADMVGQFVLLFCTTVAAMLLGLAISAAVDSADKAIMLMIFVIIPQLLFGNAFIELNGVGKLLAQLFILAYWCHDGLKSLLPHALLEEKNPATGGLVLFEYHGWGLDLCIILLFGALYYGLAVFFLQRKDVPYGKPYHLH